MDLRALITTTTPRIRLSGGVDIPTFLLINEKELEIDEAQWKCY